MNAFPDDFKPSCLDSPDRHQQIEHAKQILRQNIYDVMTDPEGKAYHAFAFARPICGNSYKGLKLLIDDDRQICDEILGELRERGFYCGYCKANFYYDPIFGQVDAIGIVRATGFPNTMFTNIFSHFGDPFHHENL